MLLDEQAVTCHVALLPAGVQSLRQFQIRITDLSAYCISPYFPEPTSIQRLQLGRQPAGETKAPRDTRP